MPKAMVDRVGSQEPMFDFCRGSDLSGVCTQHHQPPSPLPRFRLSLQAQPRPLGQPSSFSPSQILGF